MSQFLVRLAMLCGVWMLALGHLGWGNFIVGFIISVGMLLVLGGGIKNGPSTGPSVGRRLLRTAPFLLAIVRDITVATWEVAMVVLGRRRAKPRHVEVPVGARTPTGVAVTALIVTLVPGSVFIDVDWDRGIMLFHFLDAPDPDETRARIAHFYDRYQRWVFP